MMPIDTSSARASDPRVASVAQYSTSSPLVAPQISLFRRILYAALLVVSTLLPASRVCAQEIGGVRFPTQEKIGETTLSLNGLGLREATIFKVDVYAAALYVVPKDLHTSAESILASPNPKMLRMHFLRSVDREKIVEAWENGYANNQQNLSGLESTIQSFNAAMKTMESGERMSLTFGSDGVLLQINNQAAQAFPGEAFARATLAIWLGPNPPNEGLKSGLLGRKE